MKYWNVIVKNGTTMYFLLAFLFLLPLFSQESAQNIPAKRILLISPFNISFAQYYQQVSSYLDVLSHSGVSYLLTHLEMDTLNQPSEEVIRQQFDRLLPEIKAGKYDIIVTFGENAFALLKDNVRHIPKKTAIIFCGQESYDKKKMLSLPNTVGVFQRVSPEENIHLARILFPKKKKLVLLTNWTPTGKRIKLQTEIYLKQNPGLELVYIDNETTSTESMLSQVAAAGPDSMVLFYGWYNRRVINFASLEYIMHRLGNRPDIPVFVMFDSMLRFAVVGGYVEQGKHLGMEAAEKTVQLLRGENISHLEDSTIRQALVLNWDMLKYYHVNLYSIPEYATILGEPVSFWSRHKEILLPATVYFFLISIFLLILMISFFRYRNLSRRMKAILSHLPMRIAIADDKEKIHFNYSNDDSVPEFSKKLFSLREFPPKLYEMFRDCVHQVFQTGNSFSKEYISANRHRRADFVKIPSEVFGTETVLWASIDIEELHQAKLNMEELMNRFKLTLNSVDDGVIAIDANGIIMLVNPVAEQLIGASEKELVGQKMADSIKFVDAADDTPVHLQHPLSGTASANDESDLVLIAQNGARFHVDTKSAPLREPDGTVSGAVIVIRDISHERQLNLQLRIYADQQKIINSILEKIMLDINDDSGAMKLALRVFCEHLKADRCYIRQIDEEQDRISPLIEYSAYEKQSVLVSLPSVKLQKDSRWLQKLKNHESLSYPDFDEFLQQKNDSSFYDAPPEKKIHSFYAAGVFDGSGLWGDVGIIFEQKGRMLTEPEMQLLWGVAHMIEIILERKKRRSQLERSEYEKLLILDTIQIPIFLFGSKFNLICANHAAEKIINESAYELSIKCCMEHPCGPDCPKDCPVRLSFSDHKMHMKELQIAKRDYQLFASPIIIHEKLAYVLANLIDVTDFNTSQRRLTSALMDAQNASKAKSLFLATMSHELRTPLNAVIGFSELLKQGSLPKEEQEEYLNSIHLAGNTLLELINDILDFSRIEADQIILSPKETNFAATASELQAVFKKKAEEKGVLLTFGIPPNMPLLILDEFKLRQILMNLIGNAIKFTDKGYVCVSFDFFAETADKGTFSVSIKDTGVGIRQDCQQAIFEPFVQQDTVRDAHIYKGSGLGLAISRRLALKMGGDILLESALGEGSLFTLVLRNVPFLTQASIAVPPVPEAVLGSFPGIRILLVDDVPINLQVLEAMLKKLNIATFSASSGSMALSLLEKDIPDFILTDMWMPGLNGTDLAKLIRANPDCSQVKIIAVTADVVAEDTFNMNEFDAVLLKPVTLEKLSALFEKFRTRK